MSTRDFSQLTELQGRRVSVALADGSRIDDCQLVSAGRHGVPTLWLVDDGADVFIALERVIDVWEAPDPATCSAPKPVE